MTKPAPTTRPLDEMIVGAGLIAGSANVIMQLGRPGVGYGVLESKVDSGNLFHRPWKRTRTTFTYLAVATLGTDDEKRKFRQAVNRVHAHVRSDESSPVRYNAFDRELQMWVAACMYKGFEDSYEALSGKPIPEQQRESLYSAAAPLGTTLQVPPEMWPASREDFAEYWAEGLEQISIDEPVRELLLDIAALRFLPTALSVLFGRFNEFITTGFLPETFREQMHLTWTARDQRRFDRITTAIGAIALRLPRPLRQFPFGLLLWDLRRRIRTGRPLV
ncbi:oxygenase MpaB family protein [Saccharopolyspora taberi]|uniref:Oxygenase MpaB family protein n=1 Tax=Saccharopolyspora taberi TaxID=60895 RepID=A0ABN3VAT0_9PSEU